MKEKSDTVTFIRKNITLTNIEFVDKIFGKDGYRAHVTSFREDPSRLDELGLRHFWGGGIWKDKNQFCTGDRNNFYTVSVFLPDPVTSDYRRRKVAFDRAYVIVFDDIAPPGVEPGEGNSAKVSWSKLKLPPTYVVETSKDNMQVGYALPVDGDPRGGKVAGLLDLLVGSGLVSDATDPGMKGVTRYVRLPLGTNTKAKYGLEGFKHVVNMWFPNTRYTLEDIAKAHDLTKELEACPDDLGGGGAPVTVDPDRDWILETLAYKGLIQSEDKVKKLWHVTCPFVDEHTGRADSGAAYLGSGLWTCHHGHCVDRDHHEFTARLEELFPDAVATNRSKITKADFDDGQEFPAGIPPKVKAAEDFGALEDAFGTEAATEHTENVVLGPFQTKMELALDLDTALSEGLSSDQAWLLKNIAPEEGIGGIIGRPGAGKSFSALDMALRASCGMDWNGHAWKREGLSLYVASEGGRVSQKHRMLGWAQEHAQGGKNARVFPGSFDFGQENAEELKALVIWLRRWSRERGLPVIQVFVDTLARNMTGDENSATDMSVVMRNCEDLQRALGCFVWIIHHTGKDVSKGARGSSAFLGATDVMITIDKEVGASCGRTSLDKSRHGIDGLEWGFELKTVTMGVDIDGDPITTLVPLEAAIPTPSAGHRKPLSAMGEALFRTFQRLTGTPPQPVDRTDLANAACQSVRDGDYPDLDVATTQPPRTYKQKIGREVVEKGYLLWDRDADTVDINPTDFTDTEVDQNEEE